MAHVAKFNAKQIAIYGKSESDTADITAADVIIMTGLTYDPNIASNSEQLTGDKLSRDTIFTITDSFAEFSGDTYLPVLGSLTQTASSSTELPIAPFLSSCNLASTKGDGKGLPSVIVTDLNNASNSLVAGASINSEINADLSKIDALVDKLRNNDANNASASSLSTSIKSYISSTNNIATTLTDLLTDIPAVYSNFAATYPTDHAAACTNANTDIDNIVAKEALFSQNIANTTPAAETFKLNGQTFAFSVATNGDTLEKIIATWYGASVVGYTKNAGTVTYGSGGANTATITDNPTFPISNFTGSLATGNLVFKKPSGTFTAAEIVALTVPNGANRVVSTITVPTAATIEELNSTLPSTTILVTNLTGTASIVTNIKELFSTVALRIPDLRTTISNTSGTAAFKYLNDAAGLTINTGNLATTIDTYSFTNATATNSTLKCEIRKNSYDVAEQKRIVITGARGTVDLTIKVGERPKLKLNMHGNFRSSGVADNTTAFAIGKELLIQKTNLAPVTSYSNIALASLGTVAGTTNIAFQSLSATNIDGFSMERTLTGAGNFWYPNPIAHDVTISILEEVAGDDANPDSRSFHPEDNIGKEFVFKFEQGAAQGESFAITLTKLTLKGYKHSTQGNVSTQDLTFECAGTTTITLK